MFCNQNLTARINSIAFGNPVQRLRSIMDAISVSNCNCHRTKLAANYTFLSVMR